MKKIGLIFTAFLALAIVFAACAKNATDAKKSTTTETVNAQYLPATDAPVVELASLETPAETILVEDTGDTGDTSPKFDFPTILNIVLSVLGVLLAGFMAKFKLKLNQVINLGRQVLEVGEVAEAALADNAITAEEISRIKKEAQDVKEAFAQVIAFKKQE